MSAEEAGLGRRETPMAGESTSPWREPPKFIVTEQVLKKIAKSPCRIGKVYPFPFSTSSFFPPASNDASLSWSGQLPTRAMRNAVLSCKVFLGGVPWDITETALFTAFNSFGPIRIEWPGKDNSSIPKGYLYVIFENERQVKALLAACSYDYGSGGSWYYKISSRRMRNKEVQVRFQFSNPNIGTRSVSQFSDFEIAKVRKRQIFFLFV